MISRALAELLWAIQKYRGWWWWRSATCLGLENGVAGFFDALMDFITRLPDVFLSGGAILGQPSER